MPSLVPSRPLRLRSRVLMSLVSWTSELQWGVPGGRKGEPHQRVDGLRRGVDDVDEALVRAHLEVLARVLVLVGRSDDAVDVLLRRQRHRAGHLRARPGHRVDDLPRRGVDDLVVIGLQPDADLLSRHQTTSFASWFRLDCPTPAVGRVATSRTHATHTFVRVEVFRDTRGTGLNGISWCGANA